MPGISAKYSGHVMDVLMALSMGLIMSFVVTYINPGFPVNLSRNG